jgi:hypothetical protein
VVAAGFPSGLLGGFIFKIVSQTPAQTIKGPSQHNTCQFLQRGQQRGQPEAI